jgi:hypothetical protein
MDTKEEGVRTWTVYNPVAGSHVHGIEFLG